MSDPPDIQTVSKAQLRAPGVLARIRQLSPWRFVFVTSMILVAAKLLQFPLWMIVFHYYQPSGEVSTDQPPWEGIGRVGYFLVLVLAGPWIETLLCQALLMVMTPRHRRPTIHYVVPATILFCVLHGAGLGWWLYWARLASLDWWLEILPHGFHL